jgi:hypothetical protein
MNASIATELALKEAQSELNHEREHSAQMAAFLTEEDGKVGRKGHFERHSHRQLVHQLQTMSGRK